MVKLKYILHPLQTANTAKTLLNTRFNMWRFAAHGERRFFSDARYDLQNVTEGFKSRVDDSKDDVEILSRICTAYATAVKEFQSTPEIYKPSEKWRQLQQRNLGPVIRALLAKDVDALREMYRNFFRDPCSTGLIGVPYGMSKAYFGGAIKDVHRKFYLSHVLYRIDYWATQTEGRFPLSDLEGPRVGNPFGIEVDNTLIHVGAEYTHYCAHRLTRLLEDAPAIVAEIGGGFGGMAYYLLRNCAGTTYLDFDTPENIALTSYYLMKAFPHLTFLLHGEAELTKEAIGRANVVLMPMCELATMSAASVDLTFSSQAMSDISPEALTGYLDNIAQMTCGSFVYIGNRQTTKSISDLVARKFDWFRLAETRFSGWHSHKISGAGVGGAAGLAASLMFEQSYRRVRNSQIETA